MNPTKQRFIVFCVFVVLIIVGVGFVVSNTLTGKAGEVDLNGKAKNIQAEKGANLGSSVIPVEATRYSVE